MSQLVTAKSHVTHYAEVHSEMIHSTIHSSSRCIKFKTQIPFLTHDGCNVEVLWKFIFFLKSHVPEVSRTTVTVTDCYRDGQATDSDIFK